MLDSRCRGNDTCAKPRPDKSRLKGHPMDAPRQVKLEAKSVRLAFTNERMKRRLPVLSGIDLSVHEGELVAIVGPSGCGKSTFLAAVDGLVKLTGGEIAVDGKPGTASGPDRAIVFQQDSLFP